MKKQTRRSKQGHAQQIAFVLQSGRFFGMKRLFLDGDLP
jgi:hypothetical protein